MSDSLDVWFSYHQLAPMLEEYGRLVDGKFGMREGQALHVAAEAWFPDVVERHIPISAHCYYENGNIPAFMRALTDALGIGRR